MFTDLCYDTVNIRRAQTARAVSSTRYVKEVWATVYENVRCSMQQEDSHQNQYDFAERVVQLVRAYFPGDVDVRQNDEIVWVNGDGRSYLVTSVTAFAPFAAAGATQPHHIEALLRANIE